LDSKPCQKVVKSLLQKVLKRVILENTEAFVSTIFLQYSHSYVKFFELCKVFLDKSHSYVKYFGVM